MRPLRVLCDMDSVIADLHVPWYGLANAEHGCNVTIDEVTDWDVAKFFPSTVPIYSYLGRPGFFLDVPVIPGAVEGLRAIHEAGHEILVVTACSVPHAKGDKALWLARHFPFLKGRLITCDRNVPKDAVRGDVLIDDGPHNVIGYREAYPTSRIVTFDYPYNRHAHLHADLVAGSYRDMAAAWAKTTAAVLAWGVFR